MNAWKRFKRARALFETHEIRNSNMEVKISGIYEYGVQRELERSNGAYSQFSTTEIKSYKVSMNTKLTNTK